MTVLIDKHPTNVRKLMEQYPFVCGQLITPINNRVLGDGYSWALDNGGYVQQDAEAFCATVARHAGQRERCLFVALPDVVGNARLTLQLFAHFERQLAGWPRALVVQDGIEQCDIPWSRIAAVFIGGTDRFKDSDGARQVCAAARWLGKHVHIGRVNTVSRWQRFDGLADTCDGTGLAKYPHMLADISTHLNRSFPMLEGRD